MSKTRWKRARDMRSVGAWYERKFRWLRHCIYCGEPASQLDHVFPVSLAASLDLSRPSTRKTLGQGLSLVPCCEECNSIARNKPFTLIREKRRHIQGVLAKRYEKMARNAVWEDYEIEELGHTLRSFVERKAQQMGRIELRLSWPNGKTRLQNEVARQIGLI